LKISKDKAEELETAWMEDEIIRQRRKLLTRFGFGRIKDYGAQSYGYDISQPAENAHEAVQWLYFAYLGAIKEQNGAAMSLGRVSTFLDIYIERDLGKRTDYRKEAQELIDHFVMKLRLVRFLRTPEYNELFSGDPTWVTESIGGMGSGRQNSGHQKFLPIPSYFGKPRPGT
jgi:formate C-acetyltransferase